MNEDNISQLGDYDAPFCEQEYTYGSYNISFFKFKSFDQFNPNQYGGGHYGPPYSFSLISPERLELRPSNFLTFSFYLLAIRKI